MQAYRDGATGLNVLQKTKEIKKSHRVPLLTEHLPRGVYDRKRGLNAVESQVTFDQDGFAERIRDYLRKCESRSNEGLSWGLANIGKHLGRSCAPNVEYLVGGVFFDELVEDPTSWEEALERGVMDSFEIPPAPLDDPVEDERGWEEALDRDLMDRFVNPPAHLSEHDLWCCRQGVEVATWSPCSRAQPRLQSSKDAFLAHEVHRGNLSDLSILKKFVGGTVSNVQALPILKT